MCSHNQEIVTQKEEKKIFLLSCIILVLGLIFTLIYLYLDEYNKSQGEIATRAGAILALHGMLVQSFLYKIKDYTTSNINGQEVLVKREIAKKFKCLKEISFYYIFIGTTIWALIDLTYMYLR